MQGARFSSRVIAGVVGFCALSPISGADVIYVDANLTTGANDGSSWDNAFRGQLGLAAALGAAVADDEVWVADGRYTPAQAGAPRSSMFDLPSSVGIYGGFAGGEISRDQRDPAVNVALLSGDLSGNDAPYPSTAGWSDNALHVVRSFWNTPSTTLDGFTISHGFANGPAHEDADLGGGVFVVSGTPTLNNLRLVHNRAEGYGAGIYLRATKPMINDCVIEDNTSFRNGGGCATENLADPWFNRCVFRNNSASRGGGADASANSQPRFFNCVFTANTATGPGGGGALACTGTSTINLVNTTVYANTASALGGGVRTSNGVTMVTNSIVYANADFGGDGPSSQLSGLVYRVTYSCIQGGFTGAGNIASDPTLTNPGNGDFAPAPGSPVIDAANSTAAVITGLQDFAGGARFRDDPKTIDSGVGPAPIVDMGAIEFQPPCPTIVSNPIGVTVCRHAAVTLEVGVEGAAPTTYQWHKDAVDIAGETAERLVLKGVTNSDEGAYTVVVFAADCPAIESDPAQIVVCATDVDCDSVIDSDDVREFIDQWFMDLKLGTLLTDFDENGTVNSTDVSDFINLWFHESAHGCNG